jgi:quinoprotein glucose dehydrogenase
MLVVLLLNVNAYAAEPDGAWSVYGGNSKGDRYSSLTQINKQNVHTLKLAWRFDAAEPGDPETNPLVVGRTLYGYTPTLNVIALDGATGKLLWKFDAGLHGAPLAPGIMFTGPARGLAYWSEGQERRLFAGVMNYLFALDPATGQPIKGFGEDGAVDLRKNLRGDFTQHYVSLTTPGVIYKDLIIVGFRTTETQPAPPGDIRAFDVRTGKLRWSFHTIPHPGELGTDSWPKNAWQNAGSANNWAGMALDEKRGIVYAPTGSAVSDFYGADRIGNNLFADTLLALDAATGKRLWHFQGVHHDIWDRDFPSPPSLLTIRRDGRAIDAIAQTTKQGFLYVFNRVTGEPLYPIREQPYPPSSVAGEVSSPTQPHPTVPEPFARQLLTEDMLTIRTPQAHDWAVEQFRTFRSEGQFVPLSVGKPTIIFPGFDGGAEWGGSAVDPRSGVIYINANDLPWTGSLVETVSGGGLGSGLYQAQCSVCHGPNRKGSPPAFPSLTDVADRLSPEEIGNVIHSGKGRMPPFPLIQSFALTALVDYVRTGTEPVASPTAPAPPANASSSKQEMTATLAGGTAAARFRFTGYNKFLDPDGYPAVKPPWGTLNAIDLNTGRYLWKIPLGEYPELAGQGVQNTGSENYGGPIVTASGLLFIGATIYDRKLRAFDSKDGSLLWETELPYAGTATPATYMIDGKQYLVIATNNARNGKAPQGSAYVAYSLP